MVGCKGRFVVMGVVEIGRWCACLYLYDVLSGSNLPVSYLVGDDQPWLGGPCGLLVVVVVVDTTGSTLNPA